MIDRAQCEFLLAKDIIEKINRLLKENKFENVRLCFPPHEDYTGKIVLLVSDLTQRDAYDELRDQQRLRDEVGNEDIALVVEEGIKQDYKAEIVGRSVKFDVENIQKILSTLQESIGYTCEVTEKEDGNDLRMNFTVVVKRSRVDDKTALIKDLKQGLNSAIEPHLVLNGNNKRPFQA